MQLKYDNLEIIYSANDNLDNIWAVRPLKPFDSDICSFLNAVSHFLLKYTPARNYPDVITFAFWCRKSSIDAMAKQWNSPSRIGRGVVFHISPSNVPVNFAYSLVAGLLAGNANIVRIPTREFEQVKIICDAFKNILEKEEYSKLASYITLLRYERNEEINKYLTSLCDIRIIWGGDNAIREVRKAPLSSKAFDVTFADRYSLSIIYADKYLNEINVDKVAQDFYNDTYLFDQNACTAPHLIIWLGEKDKIEQAKLKFWNELHLLVVKKYKMQPIQAIDKLTTFYRSSIDIDEKLEEMPDNTIVRIDLSKLVPGIEHYRCQGGYFYEYSAKTISEIVPIITRKYQTLSYYGFEQKELSRLIEDGLHGIDRIVPIGKTMDFSLNWDGYNLISTLSRKIEII